MIDLVPEGVRWSEDLLDRNAVARDLWPGGTLRFWKGEHAPAPRIVVWPSTDAQVHAVLRRAEALKVPVIPYGMGSGVCGGARGREDAVTVDVKALDSIGPLDTERWTVDCGAGVNGQHLEDWLDARGFTLGHSPSSIWCSSVGGWAAARSAGQFSSKYGVFEDMVLQLRAVSPTRGPFIVGEGGDAPDAWMDSLLGSEGTLAVITSLRLRVWPKPQARALRGWSFPSVEAAVEAMRGLMQNELWPAVIRLYDPVDTRIGGKTKPEKDPGDRSFLKELLHAVDGLPEVRKRLLSLPLRLPGLINEVFDRMAAGCMLIVGFEGDPAVVAASERAGNRILTAAGGEDLGVAPGERWFRSRHHVSYKLMPIFERGGFADTMEVACAWSQLVPLYHAVRDALSPTVVVMAHMSHCYPEGASIYFSFAGRGDVDVYDATWKQALDAVLAIGGTATHHHGVGSLKAHAASVEVGAAVAGWRELKHLLDPKGVMNPGRLYVDVEGIVPPPVAFKPEPSDNLAHAHALANLAERRDAGAPREPLWDWESFPMPPRWQRLPWQTGVIEVSGTVDGHAVRLGRAPRSAAGPDLRGWLSARDPQAICTFATAELGARWLGEATCDRPWEVARELLRGDLRPAVLNVVRGRLRVGFRGAAAASFGAVASTRVPGGLAEIPWDAGSLPSGRLVPCEPGDERCAMTTPQGYFRREHP